MNRAGISRRSFLLTGLSLIPMGCYPPTSVEEQTPELERIEYKQSHSLGNIVFTHGLGGSYEEMFRFGRYWGTERRYTTLLWNVPKQTRTLTQMTEDIESLVDQEGLVPSVLVGNSAGGMASLKAALDHPEKYKGLILVASGHRVVQSTNPKSWLGLRQDISRDESEVIMDILKTYLPIENLKVPTVIYAGEKDVVFPIAIAEEFKSRAPKEIVKNIRVFPDAEHNMILSRQQEIFDALQEDLPALFSA